MHGWVKNENVEDVNVQQSQLSFINARLSNYEAPVVAIIEEALGVIVRNE